MSGRTTERTSGWMDGSMKKLKLKSLQWSINRFQYTCLCLFARLFVCLFVYVAACKRCVCFDYGSRFVWMSNWTQTNFELDKLNVKLFRFDIQLFFRSVSPLHFPMLKLSRSWIFFPINLHLFISYLKEIHSELSCIRLPSS